MCTRNYSNITISYNFIFLFNKIHDLTFWRSLKISSKENPSILPWPETPSHPYPTEVIPIFRSSKRLVGGESSSRSAMEKNSGALTNSPWLLVVQKSGKDISWRRSSFLFVRVFMFVNWYGISYEHISFENVTYLEDPGIYTYNSIHVNVQISWKVNI